MPGGTYTGSLERTDGSVPLQAYGATDTHTKYSGLKAADVEALAGAGSLLRGLWVRGLTTGTVIIADALTVAAIAAANIIFKVTFVDETQDFLGYYSFPDIAIKTAITIDITGTIEYGIFYV